VTETIDFEAPSWKRIYCLLLNQSQKIYQSGFKPKTIVAISRGGWLPARILSDLLGNPNLASVKVESYFGIGNAEVCPKLTESLSRDISGQSDILVDEVVDSGSSMELVARHLRERGAEEVRTAALYLKSCCRSKPDFFEKETSCWVVFPWEVRETIREILDDYKHDTIRAKAVIAKVAEAGVSKRLITRFLREFSEAKSC